MFIEFFKKCSPQLDASWLGLLCKRDTHSRQSSVPVKDEGKQSEPTPQLPEVLVDHWHNSLPTVAESPQRFSCQSKTLASRAVAAQRRREATQREYEFWTNRLKLLRKEAESAERSLSSSQIVVEHHSSAISSALRSQLEEERSRSETLRQDRHDANKIQRDAHRKALREAMQANLLLKRENSNFRRQESRESSVFVEEERNRELHRRALLKESVQQDKVVNVLKRARIRAMKAEETKRTYEQRVEMIEEQDRRQQAVTAAVIQETSKLVQKLRQLQEAAKVDV